MQYSIVIFNFILYLLAYYYFSIRRKTFFKDIGVFLLLIYALSSGAALYHYHSGLRDYDHLTIMPSIYLFAMILLTSAPVLSFQLHEHTRIKVNDKVITYLSYFLLIVSIEPFFENFNLISSILSIDSASYVTEIHAMRHQGDVDNLINYSEVGMFFYRWNSYMRDLAPVLMFYQFTKNRVKLLDILGFVLVIININIVSFVNSSRSEIVNNIIYIFFLYLLFKPQIKPEILKKLNRYLYLAFIFILILFSLLTIWRFYQTFGQTSFQEASIFQWVALYLGEGTINFNEHVWALKVTTEGDYVLTFFKDLFGAHTFVENVDRREFWEAKTQIPLYIFYTYVGSFVIDFGLVLSTVIFAVGSLLLYVMLRNPRSVGMHTLFIFAVYYKVIATGFCFYTYSGMIGRQLFINLILVLLLYATFKFKYNIRKK